MSDDHLLFKESKIQDSTNAGLAVYYFLLSLFSCVVAVLVFVKLSKIICDARQHSEHNSNIKYYHISRRWNNGIFCISLAIITLFTTSQIFCLVIACILALTSNNIVNSNSNYLELLSHLSLFRVLLYYFGKFLLQFLLILRLNYTLPRSLSLIKKSNSCSWNSIIIIIVSIEICLYVAAVLLFEYNQDTIYTKLCLSLYYIAYLIFNFVTFILFLVQLFRISKFYFRVTFQYRIQYLCAKQLSIDSTSKNNNFKYQTHFFHFPLFFGIL